MSRIILFENSIFNAENITQVLIDVNHMFNPDLKTRILKKSGLNTFGEYVNKVICNGSILISCEKEVIEGVCMIYHNDLVNFTAYIPIIAVRNNFQKKGVGQRLLEYSFELAVSNK